MATVSEYLQTWKLKLSTTKMVSAAFHLNNKEAKHELKVKYNNETLPFCSEPKYLRVTLDRSLMYRRHLESLRKNLTRAHAPEVACWLRLGCWSNNCANSHPGLGAINQSTAHLLGAIVLIPAGCLDACVLHQWTTFQPSQAFNLLSFVAMEPHCL